MMRFKAITAFLLFLILASAAVSGFGKNDAERERSLRGGNIPGKKHQEWAKADRCTKCHMLWSWEWGYYRGWDRYGFISDYEKFSPYGYKDPYGLDAPPEKITRYYYSDWWNGEWLKDIDKPDPSMNMSGGYKVNNGDSKPSDFGKDVIIVDKSGKGSALTIRQGIEMAKPGQTVFVRPGKYLETVKLKQGIRLWGENPHTTIIDSDLLGSAITAVNNCDISGFTLTGSGMNYKDYSFSAGIYAPDCDSTLVIHGNIFHNNAVFGVLAESSLSSGKERGVIKIEDSLEEPEFKGLPNPRIIGNTFYIIGERAVYSIHAAPEIANNVFIGNVKTVGMTNRARPFIHHNVFYRNNVSVNVNRSMPVIANNIMVKNYWGQRIVEGGCPVVHDNITWESPYYKEFAEDGTHIAYKPYPGNGEISRDPGFIDPDNGDFTSRKLDFKSSDQKKLYGLVKSPDIQQPPKVKCERSWAEEFLCKTDKTREIIASIDKQNSAIKNLSVSYDIKYRSFMECSYNKDGGQKVKKISDKPLSGMDYEAVSFVMDNSGRTKKYRNFLFSGGKTSADSGTVVYNNTSLTATGKFSGHLKNYKDPYNVGEKMTRENYGGIYLDYDQYMNGAIGPGGTYYYGYLRILGGEVKEKTEVVDGRECVVVQYPNIGADQYFKFYLDKNIGYKPAKLEHYFEHELYRKIDGYCYTDIDGVYMPVYVKITDYAVKKPYVGKVVGECEMKVQNIQVNGYKSLTLK